MGGLCSISCSLVLPIAFFALLAWKELSGLRRAGLVGLLTLGMALVCCITTQNIRDILTRDTQQEGGGGAAPALLGWSAVVQEY